MKYKIIQVITNINPFCVVILSVDVWHERALIFLKFYLTVQFLF